MKTISLTEASRILKLSPSYTKTLIVPHKIMKNPHGGHNLLLYDIDRVNALVIERTKMKKAELKILIQKESTEVKHPGKEYITLSEAAFITGLTKRALKKLHKPISRKSKITKKTYFFFLRENILNYNKTQKEKTHTGDNYTKDDPYGTMIPPKKQGRKCPISGCGADLLEGQYMCTKCRKKQPQDMDFDAEYAYGGMVE